MSPVLHTCFAAGCGGDANIHCTCTQSQCYATAAFGGEKWTQSSNNKDLMLWMRCWQWRYEDRSLDLLNAAVTRLEILWSPPIWGTTLYTTFNFSIPWPWYLQDFWQILPIFSPLFWNHFALFDGTWKNIWKSQWIWKVFKWKVCKRSRGFQPGGMIFLSHRWDVLVLRGGNLRNAFFNLHHVECRDFVAMACIAQLFHQSLLQKTPRKKKSGKISYSTWFDW